MAYDSAFSPFGLTYLVGTGAVQVVSTTNSGPTSYRVRNLSGTQQYFGWAAPIPGGATPTIATTAPSAGAPKQIIGLLPYSVEVFSGLPSNAWFKADGVGAFEITSGEGL